MSDMVNDIIMDVIIPNGQLKTRMVGSGNDEKLEESNS